MMGTKAITVVTAALVLSVSSAVAIGANFGLFGLGTTFRSAAPLPVVATRSADGAAGDVHVEITRRDATEVDDSAGATAADANASPSTSAVGRGARGGQSAQARPELPVVTPATPSSTPGADHAAEPAPSTTPGAESAPSTTPTTSVDTAESTTTTTPLPAQCDRNGGRGRPCEDD